MVIVVIVILPLSGIAIARMVILPLSGMVMVILPLSGNGNNTTAFTRQW